MLAATAASDYPPRIPAARGPFALRAPGLRYPRARRRALPATHIVRPGEHLGSIAEAFGFENYSVIWEHPKNASLKTQRGDPFLLAPGDEVFVPDHVRLTLSRATSSSHDVKVNLDTLTVKLRILLPDGTPDRDAKVTLRVEAPQTDGEIAPEEQELTTDGDGNVSLEVAKHVTAGTLVIDDIEYPLAIGALDPIDTESGVEQRLMNLGYLRRPNGEVEPDDLRIAVEDFQADNGLEVTGEREDIESDLETAHGS